MCRAHNVKKFGDLLTFSQQVGLSALAVLDTCWVLKDPLHLTADQKPVNVGVFNPKSGKFAAMTNGPRGIRHRQAAQLSCLHTLIFRGS